MLKKKLLDRWWSRWFLIMASYVVAADVLPNLLLVMVEGVGYLPYSDRPGPGWHMPPHIPRGPEWAFFVGFSVLLLRAAAFYGLLFGVSGLILGFCSLPRWALRVFAVPLAFLASGFAMAGVGWFIAISSLGVYIAAGCGAVWGLLVFPRLIPHTSFLFPTPARIALPIVILFGGTYGLIKPLLPNPGLTNGKVEVVRRDDAGTDLSKLDLSFVGPSIAEGVEGAGKYLSVNRMDFTTDERNQIRVLLIIDDDRPIPHTFVLPRSGNAVYRQRQGKWIEEHIQAKSSQISLSLVYSDGNQIQLEPKGPSCCSMSQSFGPYR